MRLSDFLRSSALKLLAILFALGIWVGVTADRRERVAERAFDVPVALIGVPRDIIITTPVQGTISVRCRGRESILRSISSQNVEASINFTDTKPGLLKVTIPPQALNLPPEVEVLSITPAKMTFRLEARRQKIVPVRPYLVGELPHGFVFDPADIEVTPPTAIVSGPASLIRDYVEASTERIILTGRTAPFRQNVGLVSDTPLIRVVEPTSAQVFVNVIQTVVPDEIVAPPPAPATSQRKKTK